MASEVISTDINLAFNWHLFSWKLGNKYGSIEIFNGRSLIIDVRYRIPL